jgi:hypothetical protein
MAARCTQVLSSAADTGPNVGVAVGRAVDEEDCFGDDVGGLVADDAVARGFGEVEDDALGLELGEPPAAG